MSAHLLPEPDPADEVQFVLARELPGNHIAGGPHEYINVAPVRKTAEEAWQDVKGEWPADWHVLVLRREVRITPWRLEKADN